MAGQSVPVVHETSVPPVVPVLVIRKPPFAPCEATCQKFASVQSLPYCV